jgi:hypothetical protein
LLIDLLKKAGFNNFIEIIVIRIQLKSNSHFQFTDHDGLIVGSLDFKSTLFTDCKLVLDKTYEIVSVHTGIWHCIFKRGKKRILLVEIIMALGGIIELKFSKPYKRYFLKRMGTFNSRFSLLNKFNEEIVGLKPNICLLDSRFEIIIQKNMEQEHECTDFVVLLSAFCSLIYINMLTGALPATINV